MSISYNNSIHRLDVGMIISQTFFFPQFLPLFLYFFVHCFLSSLHHLSFFLNVFFPYLFIYNWGGGGGGGSIVGLARGHRVQCPTVSFWLKHNYGLFGGGGALA